MKKILCIGEALIDMICTDKGKTLAEGQHFLKKPGGAPTNVAAAIAALGGRVELLARVGNDPFGKLLIDTMKEFGVSTNGMIKDDEHFTTMAFVSLLENGERDFVFSRGADGFLEDNDLVHLDTSDFGIAHFGSATAFLPGNLQHTYRYCLQSALVNKLFVSFDPNYRHLLYRDKISSFVNQSWRFISSSDFIKLSEDEAMLITGRPNAEESAQLLFEKTNGVVTITLGAKGSLLGFNKTIEIIPAAKANVIDTTGAGDAFVGSILYQLSNYSPEQIKALSHDNWKSIVMTANRTGAMACEHMGAMEAFREMRNNK
jgi:fructokinase